MGFEPFVQNVEKWSNIHYKTCGVNTAKLCMKGLSVERKLRK